jgi:hypothetical protein
MDRVFVWMMAAAILHIFEEYVYPGGFLRWMRILITSASLTVVDAVIINGAFLGLVFSPLMDAPAKTPILSISIPSLLLINGMLHVPRNIHNEAILAGRHYSRSSLFPYRRVRNIRACAELAAAFVDNSRGHSARRGMASDSVRAPRLAENHVRLMNRSAVIAQACCVRDDRRDCSLILLCTPNYFATVTTLML